MWRIRPSAKRRQVHLTVLCSSNTPRVECLPVVYVKNVVRLYCTMHVCEYRDLLLFVKSENLHVVKKTRPLVGTCTSKMIHSLPGGNSEAALEKWAWEVISPLVLSWSHWPCAVQGSWLRHGMQIKERSRITVGYWCPLDRPVLVALTSKLPGRCFQFHLISHKH